MKCGARCCDGRDGNLGMKEGRAEASFEAKLKGHGARHGHKLPTLER